MCPNCLQRLAENGKIHGYQGKSCHGVVTLILFLLNILTINERISTKFCLWFACDKIMFWNGHSLSSICLPKSFGPWLSLIFQFCLFLSWGGGGGGVYAGSAERNIQSAMILVGMVTH